jgi:hypothetical protein
VAAMLRESKEDAERVKRIYASHRAALRDKLDNDELLVDIPPDGNCFYTSLKRLLHFVVVVVLLNSEFVLGLSMNCECI